MLYIVPFVMFVSFSCLLPEKLQILAKQNSQRIDRHYLTI
ncbi:MAG: hypothetical protein AVDCRST_MAG95-954 [uncultured Adhaeribacter sp.]|uniref:Uncharacterized protein n=1 Tax=uncultured Adhaeribacter sp. TaxID=448109 RepID=A0A6J4HQY1_9BACT|nr:MAG: hypothetical protein AVDCRST_MAG95-954 [uncultured Adhaeribacter sp.]